MKQAHVKFTLYVYHTYTQTCITHTLYIHHTYTQTWSWQHVKRVHVKLTLHVYHTYAHSHTPDHGSECTSCLPYACITHTHRRTSHIHTDLIMAASLSEHRSDLLHITHTHRSNHGSSVKSAGHFDLIHISHMHTEINHTYSIFISHMHTNLITAASWSERR